MTTWPRLDNDAPSVLERCGSNSPTEVVGTMSEGCDLLEQSTGFLVGYPRAPFASVVTPLVAGLPCVSSPLETHRRVLWGTLLGTWGRAPGLLRDGVVGKPSREGSGRPLRDPPKKGGPGPPQKGGCRDTKQCKFWRVSSVLIQGVFCFFGVRGVSGGVRRGVDFGGSPGWVPVPGNPGIPRQSSGPVAPPPRPGDPDQRTLGSPRSPASYLRWRCTCWGTQRERREF